MRLTSKLIGFKIKWSLRELKKRSLPRGIKFVSPIIEPFETLLDFRKHLRFESILPGPCSIHIGLFYTRLSTATGESPIFDRGSEPRFSLPVEPFGTIDGRISLTYLSISGAPKRWWPCKRSASNSSLQPSSPELSRLSRNLSGPVAGRLCYYRVCGNEGFVVFGIYQGVA